MKVCNEVQSIKKGNVVWVICTKLGGANFNLNFLGSVADVYTVICGTW